MVAAESKRLPQFWSQALDRAAQVVLLAGVAFLIHDGSKTREALQDFKLITSVEIGGMKSVVGLLTDQQKSADNRILTAEKDLRAYVERLAIAEGFDRDHARRLLKLEDVPAVKR